MAPSASDHTRRSPSSKKRKPAASTQSSPAPRKKARKDPSAQETSEKGSPAALETSERRLDKGKAKASVNGNDTVEQTEISSKSGANPTVQGTSTSLNAEAPKDASQATPPLSRPPKPNRRKLAPQRPWPTVPASSNATGPYSARAEGKNKILISRKTPLSAYLRRCKACILEDGYKTLYLSATSAAIPVLLTIAASLPEMLPYAKGEIRVEYMTGTVRCMDEILPDEDAEEDGDPTIQSELVERKIARLSATLVIGDGQKEITGKEKKMPKKLRGGGQRKLQMNSQGAQAKTTSQPEMSSDDDMFE